MHATIDRVRLGNSLVGKDVFAIYTVDSSTIPGFTIGQKIALDGLIFNIDSQNCGQIKGDVSPVVPEPATLSLDLVRGVLRDGPPTP